MSNYSIQAAKDAAQKVSEETALDIKSGACLLSAEITGACGERTLAESKSLLEGEVLDSKLLSGTKLRWFPKEALRFVNKHSATVRRLLAQNGISFGKGATMVPISILDTVMEELEAARGEFEDDVMALKSQYDGLIAEHKSKNPDIAKHIEKCVEPVDRFAGRFTFEVHPPMAIQPLFDGDEKEMTATAADQLMAEVAAEADRIYDKYFSGAEKATHKKMGPVFSLRDKLMNLSFLDASVSRVALKFDDVLSQLPKTYPLEGGDFHTVCHFLTLVSDQGKLKSYGSGGKDLDEEQNQTDEFSFDEDDVTESISDTTTQTDKQPEAVESDLSVAAEPSEETEDTLTPQSEALDDLSGIATINTNADSGDSGEWDFDW